MPSQREWNEAIHEMSQSSSAERKVRAESRHAALKVSRQSTSSASPASISSSFDQWCGCFVCQALQHIQRQRRLSCPTAWILLQLAKPISSSLISECTRISSQRSSDKAFHSPLLETASYEAIVLTLLVLWPSTWFSSSFKKKKEPIFLGGVPVEYHRCLDVGAVSEYAAGPRNVLVSVHQKQLTHAETPKSMHLTNDYKS